MAKQPTKTAAPDPRILRQHIATLTPGTTAFGSVPAAKLRIDDALARVASARAHIAQAAAVLADLKAETVTGSNPPVSGAEAILGADLENYEALIAEANAFFKAFAAE